MSTKKDRRQSNEKPEDQRQHEGAGENADEQHNRRRPISPVIANAKNFDEAAGLRDRAASKAGRRHVDVQAMGLSARSDAVVLSVHGALLKGLVAGAILRAA